MEITTKLIRDYLTSLRVMSGDDSGATISMHEVGAAIGLARDDAGQLAEELMVEGLVELKNLAGGIAITAQGRQLLGADTGEVKQPAAFTLGGDEILDTARQQGIAELLVAVKAVAGEMKGGYEAIEEVVFHLKTLEVQLLNPRPRTGVVREILRAVAASMEKNNQPEQAQAIRRVIG
jgi:hypothetical protein